MPLVAQAAQHGGQGFGREVDVGAAAQHQVALERVALHLAVAAQLGAAAEHRAEALEADPLLVRRLRRLRASRQRQRSARRLGFDV